MRERESSLEDKGLAQSAERTTTMTKMEMFVTLSNIPAVIENADLSNAIQHEIDLLVKHASVASSKPDPRTVENSMLKNEILAILSDFGHPMTITEVVAQVSGEYANPVTNGRVSSLLTVLKKDGKVVRSEVKRVVYFAIAE